MTVHPCLFPTLFVAGVSIAAAALLRRVVRKEYPSALPWLWTWGALCAVPALLYAALSLPCFADAASELFNSSERTWLEVLAGAAGILPGLLWDDIDERMERTRELPLGMRAALLRALSVAATAVLILIPYCFLFR